MEKANLLQRAYDDKQWAKHLTEEPIIKSNNHTFLLEINVARIELMFTLLKVF